MLNLSTLSTRDQYGLAALTYKLNNKLFTSSCGPDDQHQYSRFENPHLGPVPLPYHISLLLAMLNDGVAWMEGEEDEGCHGC